MQKVTLVLVLALIGVVAWQAVEAANLREEVETWQSESAALRADVGRLERHLAAVEGRALPEPLRSAAASEARTRRYEEGPRLGAGNASPEALADAVRDLRGRLAANEERVKEVAEQVGTTPARAKWKKPTMIRSVADAARELELDARQQGEVERVVDYAKRDLEDLHAIPNADGKTWKEVSDLKVTSGGEGYSVVMSNMAEMMKFRNTKIPGSEETYGQADRRIRDRAKADIRAVLNGAQQKTFDESFTDGMFGPSSGASVISFATTIDASDD